MQDVVKHWEGGLRTTGGALRINKVFGTSFTSYGKTIHGNTPPSTNNQENSMFEASQAISNT